MRKYLYMRKACLLGIALLSTSCTKQMRQARYAASAEKSYHAGQWDQAKIEYLKVIQVDPKNANAFARIGQMWADEGDAIRAGGFLVRARDLAPQNFENRLQLAKVYQSIGQPGEASKEAADVLKEAPENGEALVLYAQSAATLEAAAVLPEMLERFKNKESAPWKLASAVAALRKGDAVRAETLLNEALGADPKLPEVHAGLALIALSKKDQARARDKLKAAAELTPLRSREKRSYAEYLLQSGQSAEAVAYAKGLTDKARDFVGAWIVQAKAAVTNKKYDEANSLLENVLSRDPDNLDARLIRAQVLLAKKETKQAIDTLQTLDRAFPRSPLIKYQLALAHLQGGDQPQAITVLEQLLLASPGQREATLLLAQVRSASGNAAAAIDPLEAMVKNQPDLLPQRLLLADAYQKVGRSEDAANLIRDQLKKTPKDSNTHFYLGLILLGQKKNDEARREFEEAVAANPANANAIDQLVGLDLQVNKIAEAQARADAFLRTAPDAATAYFMKARAFIAEKKNSEAEASLKKAIEKDPNLGAAYNLLVQLYVATNKLPQALAELDEVLKKNPESVSALTVTAAIQDRRQDFEKSKATYEKILKLAPNSTVALNNLAYLYSEKFEDLNRAAELARKAHDLAPDNGNISDTLGWVLYKQKDYSQAAELLRQASSKIPDAPVLNFHLGMAEYMMGRKAEAKGALEKAVAAPGDFPGKEEAKQRLAMLAQGGEGAMALSAAELEKSSSGDDPIALRQIGAAYEKQGEPQKAAAAYEKAFKSNPRLGDVPFALANLYAGPLKDNARALEYAKKARELNPSDPKITAAIGKIAFRAGNFTWAYSLLQESARQFPDDFSVAHDFAWASYNSGKISEAQAIMTRVAQAPDAVLASDARRFLQLLPLDTLQKGSGASEEISQALAADSNYTPALMAKGAGLLQNDEAKAATEIYTSVLQRLPDFAPAQKRLAGIYANDPAMLEKASELAAKARRSLGDDAELGRINGAIAFQRKEYGRAVQALQAAAAKMPLDAESFFYLGMSQQASGRKVEARDNLRLSLDAGLKGTHADESRRAIAALDAEKRN